MQQKLFYPAIFHKAEDGGFWISFPDLPECLTEGNDMQEAYEMSVDALGLCLTSRMSENEDIPAPTLPEDILLDKDSFLVVIEFDLIAYKKKTNSQSVKKTLTIPEWLNEEAISNNINFSQVLQDALMERLQINIL